MEKETEVLSTTKWNIDNSHSQIEFSVKHLMITTVKGKFKEYAATVETQGDDFTTAKITFTAETKSVDTGSEQRDGHIKSDDFFAVEKYPQIKFASSRVEKKDDENYILHGDITIRDVTKPIVLNVEYGGIAKDPWGGTRGGFTVTGKLNRKEFGLQWNALTESGGALLSDEIKLNCSVQVVKG